MLSLSSYKVINTVFSGVFVPAIIILSVAVSISAFDVYKSLFFFIRISLCHLYPRWLPWLSI